MKTNLTKLAKRALIWIRDEPHHQGRWLINGREPRTEPRESYTHFELRGHRRVILISTATMAAIVGMITPSKKADRMYDLNRKGRDALRGAT